MAPKKDNLPLTLDQDQDSTGTITYANEVVAVIAGVAANEVEGVAGMCAASGISEVFSRNTKNVTRGIKVELGTEEVSVDIYLMIEYGTRMLANCTSAVIMAMTIANEKEITVSGMVMVRPGSKICPKESISNWITRWSIQIPAFMETLSCYSQSSCPALYCPVSASASATSAFSSSTLYTVAPLAQAWPPP